MSSVAPTAEAESHTHAGGRTRARVARPMRGHHVGNLVGSDDGGWLVDYPGNPHGPLAARTTMQMDPGAAHAAVEGRAAALLVFERERSDLPIVVGLLTPPPTRATNARPDAPGAERVETRPTEAVVDGKRVVFTAEDEIVLRCGRSSIQLLSDGSVRIRGTNVLSRASATNRIRGATVQIN